MPFTPFHMGPGLAVKAVTGRYFSLTVFGFCQVAIDIEPLVRMIRGDIVIHGFTHTYLGATLIAFVSVVAGRDRRRLRRRVQSRLSGQHHALRYAAVFAPVEDERPASRHLG